MEAESSLPCSQEHAKCPYPLSGEPSPHPFIPFNIISPSVSVFIQSLYLASPHQNLLHVSLLPYMCHTPRASHPPWFGHVKKVGWRLLVTELLIMKFSSVPWCILALFCTYMWFFFFQAL